MADCIVGGPWFKSCLDQHSGSSNNWGRRCSVSCDICKLLDLWVAQKTIKDYVFSSLCSRRKRGGKGKGNNGKWEGKREENVCYKNPIIFIVPTLPLAHLFFLLISPSPSPSLSILCLPHTDRLGHFQHLPNSHWFLAVYRVVSLFISLSEKSRQADHWLALRVITVRVHYVLSRSFMS